MLDRYLTPVHSHLGHFVFTTTLLPLLKQTAAEPSSDVRVITVGSANHETINNDVSFVDRSAWNNKYGDDTYANSRRAAFFRYGNSKLANILFAKELQRRLDREGVPIISLTLDPGVVNTGELTTFCLVPLGPFTPHLTSNFYTLFDSPILQRGPIDFWGIGSRDFWRRSSQPISSRRLIKERQTVFLVLQVQKCVVPFPRPFVRLGGSSGVH